MYLITHLQQKGTYHGAIYLISWNSLHPISIDKFKKYPTFLLTWFNKPMAEKVWIRSILLRL